MKIILTSVGTRGDMEPFLAIGELLRDKGHEVICAFPDQFREITESSNLKFASLGAKFIELLNSDVGKAAMGGSTGLKKFIAIIKLARIQKESQVEMVCKQREIIESEKPDKIVYNGKAIYAIIWELKNQGRTTFVSPLPYMHYVKGHTHIAFNSNFGEIFNKLTFSLAHFGIITTVKIAGKWLKIPDKINQKQVRNILRYHKSIYTISPSLFSRPVYWNDNLKVLGYLMREKNTNWIPDKVLVNFIDKHSKILFITFGSMINPEPCVEQNAQIEQSNDTQIKLSINRVQRFNFLLSPNITKPRVDPDRIPILTERRERQDGESVRSDSRQRKIMRAYRDERSE